MNVSIAVKQTRRQAIVFKEIIFLIGIAEYMRKHNPDFDYTELFATLRKLLK